MTTQIDYGIRVALDTTISSIDTKSNLATTQIEPEKTYELATLFYFNSHVSKNQPNATFCGVDWDNPTIRGKHHGNINSAQYYFHTPLPSCSYILHNKKVVFGQSFIMSLLYKYTSYQFLQCASLHQYTQNNEDFYKKILTADNLTNIMNGYITPPTISDSAPILQSPSHFTMTSLPSLSKMRHIFLDQSHLSFLLAPSEQFVHYTNHNPHFPSPHQVLYTAKNIISLQFLPQMTSLSLSFNMFNCVCYLPYITSIFYTQLTSLNLSGNPLASLHTRDYFNRYNTQRINNQSLKTRTSINILINDHSSSENPHQCNNLNPTCFHHLTSFVPDFNPSIINTHHQYDQPTTLNLRYTPLDLDHPCYITFIDNLQTTFSSTYYYSGSIASNHDQTVQSFKIIWMVKNIPQFPWLSFLFHDTKCCVHYQGKNKNTTHDSASSTKSRQPECIKFITARLQHLNLSSIPQHATKKSNDIARLSSQQPQHHQPNNFNDITSPNYNSPWHWLLLLSLQLQHTNINELSNTNAFQSLTKLELINNELTSLYYGIIEPIDVIHPFTQSESENISQINLTTIRALYHQTALPSLKTHSSLEFNSLSCDKTSLFSILPIYSNPARTPTPPILNDSNPPLPNQTQSDTCYPIQIIPYLPHFLFPSLTTLVLNENAFVDISNIIIFQQFSTLVNIEYNDNITKCSFPSCKNDITALVSNLKPFDLDFLYSSGPETSKQISTSIPIQADPQFFPNLQRLSLQGNTFLTYHIFQQFHYFTALSNLYVTPYKSPQYLSNLDQCVTDDSSMTHYFLSNVDIHQKTPNDPSITHTISSYTKTLFHLSNTIDDILQEEENIIKTFKNKQTVTNVENGETYAQYKHDISHLSTTNAAADVHRQIVIYLMTNNNNNNNNFNFTQPLIIPDMQLQLSHSLPLSNYSSSLKVLNAVEITKKDFLFNINHLAPFLLNSVVFGELTDVTSSTQSIGKFNYFLEGSDKTNDKLQLHGAYINNIIITVILNTLQSAHSFSQRPINPLTQDSRRYTIDMNTILRNIIEICFPRLHNDINELSLSIIPNHHYKSCSVGDNTGREDANEHDDKLPDEHIKRHYFSDFTLINIMIKNLVPSFYNDTILNPQLLSLRQSTLVFIAQLLSQYQTNVTALLHPISSDMISDITISTLTDLVDKLDNIRTQKYSKISLLLMLLLYKQLITLMCGIFITDIVIYFLTMFIQPKNPIWDIIYQGTTTLNYQDNYFDILQDIMMLNKDEQYHIAQSAFPLTIPTSAVQSSYFIANNPLKTSPNSRKISLITSIILPNIESFIYPISTKPAATHNGVIDSYRSSLFFSIYNDLCSNMDQYYQFSQLYTSALLFSGYNHQKIPDGVNRDDFYFSFLHQINTNLTQKSIKSLISSNLDDVDVEIHDDETFLINITDIKHFHAQSARVDTMKVMKEQCELIKFVQESQKYADKIMMLYDLYYKNHLHPYNLVLRILSPENNDNMLKNTRLIYIAVDLMVLFPYWLNLQYLFNNAEISQSNTNVGNNLYELFLKVCDNTTPPFQIIEQGDQHPPSFIASIPTIIENDALSVYSMLLQFVDAINIIITFILTTMKSQNNTLLIQNLLSANTRFVMFTPFHFLHKLPKSCQKSTDHEYHPSLLKCTYITIDPTVPFLNETQNDGSCARHHNSFDERLPIITLKNDVFNVDRINILYQRLHYLSSLSYDIDSFGSATLEPNCQDFGSKRLFSSPKTTEIQLPYPDVKPSFIISQQHQQPDEILLSKEDSIPGNNNLSIPYESYDCVTEKNSQTEKFKYRLNDNIANVLNIENNFHHTDIFFFEINEYSPSYNLYLGYLSQIETNWENNDINLSLD